MTSTARLDGGYAHGMTLEVDAAAEFVYVTVVDGVPRTVRGLRAEAAEDLISLARGRWECYVRDASQRAGQVVFFCMQPLDRSSFGRGIPPPPPARVLARQDPP